MTSSAVASYVADFDRVAGGLPGRAPWLVRWREEALARFAETGFPSARDEEWKYTSVAPLEKRAFAAEASVGEPARPGVDRAVARLAATADATHRLVFVDGRYVPGLSMVNALPSGARLQSLAAALDHDPEALQPWLASTSEAAAFAALNAAFTADGVYLHLGPGTVIEAPIHVLYLATREGLAVHPRNLLVAEARAQATVIEHYAALDGISYFTNAITQIVTAEAAMIVHVKLQEESGQAFHIAGVHGLQGHDSRLVSHSIALGALLARNDITTRFGAPGCHAMLNGLYLVGGRQHVDHHTRIDHGEPSGTSREYYRGILDGRSRAVFNGKVIVHPGAQGTDAQQANHNLLLSRDAEVDTKPQLEIYADDVKCTHGATVGQLDDTQIFYLRSRGVDEGMARSLLTYAFAEDVVQRIEIAQVRAHLERTLLARLPEGHRIEELA